jgi:hypothetical protein
LIVAQACWIRVSLLAYRFSILRSTDSGCLTAIVDALASHWIPRRVVNLHLVEGNNVERRNFVGGIHGRSLACFRLRLSRAGAMLGNDFLGFKLVFYVTLLVCARTKNYLEMIRERTFIGRTFTEVMEHFPGRVDCWREPDYHS